MRKRTIGALVLMTLFLATTASSCEHKPKGRFIDRVREYCGPAIAARYSQVDWVDRDYAADNILITCVLWPEVRTEEQVNKDQAGG